MFVDHYDDYWIIATDYSSFSIVYSCVQKNVDGECTEPHTWVYSRTPQLPDDTASIIEGILDALCVNKSALVEVVQNNGKLCLMVRVLSRTPQLPDDTDYIL